MAGQIGYQVGYRDVRTENIKKEVLYKKSGINNSQRPNQERDLEISHYEFLKRNRIAGGIDFLGGVVA